MALWDMILSHTVEEAGRADTGAVKTTARTSGEVERKPQPRHASKQISAGMPAGRGVAAVLVLCRATGGCCLFAAPLQKRNPGAATKS